MLISKLTILLLDSTGIDMHDSKLHDASSVFWLVQFNSKFICTVDQSASQSVKNKRKQ